MRLWFVDKEGVFDETTFQINKLLFILKFNLYLTFAELFSVLTKTYEKYLVAYLAKFMASQLFFRHFLLFNYKLIGILILHFCKYTGIKVLNWGKLLEIVGINKFILLILIILNNDKNVRPLCYNL